MKENGEVAVEGGVKDPAPFSVRVTLEALPPKVFPLTVIAVVPHMLPSVVDRVTVGGFEHPQLTEKLGPVVRHPYELRTVMLCMPFATFVNVTDTWKLPPSRLYVYPAPVGLVIVITAFPKPWVQSIVCVGSVGDGGWASITTGFEDADLQPTLFVTVKVYEPAGSPETVVLVPVPEVVTLPGVRVNVHVPLAGNPVKTTLPVADAQVG